MFNRRLLFTIVCIGCALIPLFHLSPDSTSPAAKIPDEWPTHFYGQFLSEIPLNERENIFLSGFPGAIKKFSTGSGQLLMRYVSRPTRKLHPAKDCFKGSGYSIRHEPILKDAEGAHWGCFNARKERQELLVCERIVDSYGREFTDVSAWYWESVLGKSQGPWWAITNVSAPL